MSKITNPTLIPSGMCMCVGGWLSCVSLTFQSRVCESYRKEVIQGVEDCVSCRTGALHALDDIICWVGFGG